MPLRLLLIISLLLSVRSSIAHAQVADAGVDDTAPSDAAPPPPDAAPPADAPPPPPPDAAPPATAPVAEPAAQSWDEVRGIAVDEPKPSLAARWVPKVILFVPRWAFWTVMQPVRFLAWSYDRFALQARFMGALFAVDQTYGVYPVAAYSTDFGLQLGLRAVHYNLFGDGEHLRLGADFGGEFRQGVFATLSSGKRLERVTATIEGRYQRRPGERFFGIGNETALPDEPQSTLIDPQTSDAAVSSRFREDLAAAKASLQVKLVDALSFRASGALTTRKFNAATDLDDNIAERYDTSKLIGFNHGVEDIYLEGELFYDSRRPTSKWQTQANDATGWYATVHYGRAKGIQDDPTDYYRYGGEVQRFFDLYQGSRVLALRLLTEGVGGTDGRSDGKISFVELPRLGGSEYLRGFAMDRFRDRVVGLGTAEYSWDLGNFLGAYLFTDVGRTWHTWNDLTLSGLHVGFGGGLEIHTHTNFMVRGQIAASREGDLYFQIVLSPAFGRRERAGRF